MSEEENINSKLKRSLERFEQDMKTNHSSFFDLSDILQIYEHYNLFGKSKEAILALNVAKSQHPYSADPYIREAEMYLSFENISLAREMISKAKILEPNNEDIIQIEVDCLAKEGKEKEALELLYSSIDYCEDRPYIYSYIAEFCQERKWFDEELKCYLQWIKEDKNNFLYMDIASCYIRAERYDDGIDSFKGFIDDDPYNHFLWNELGRLYEEKEDFENAVKAYEYITLIDEEYDGGYLLMANCLYELDDFENMKANLDLAYSKNPSNLDTLMAYGRYYKEVSNYDTARKYYLKAIDLDDSYYQSWYDYALLVKEMGTVSDSLPYFRKAFIFYPSDPDLVLDYFYAELEVNGLTRAESVYADGRFSTPDNLELFESMALELSKEKKYEEAIQVLIQDFVDQPLTAKMKFLLAVAHYGLGNPLLGERYFHEAVIEDESQHQIVNEANPNFRWTEQLRSFVDLYKNRK